MGLEPALAGMHVIEVATYLPGPACTQLLAGMGARVTKVARPGGDPLRGLAPLNAAYGLFNDGKAERELDLKTPAGAAALRELAAGADVLVDGLRPGSLERLGLGAAALRAANPRLIYCALSGYGVDGPASGMAGHDLNFVARSGLLAATTARGEPAMPGTQLADLVSGLAAATAILAALSDRARTGVGCTLDAPMLDATRWLMAPWYAVERARAGSRLLSGEAAYYRVYRTADGRHLAVATLEPHFWERFCAAIGRPDLIPRQYELDQEALAAEVAVALQGRTLAAWRAIFDDLDACVSPCLTVAEAAAEGPAGGRLPVRAV
jgi:alpha-methylacyl-CoA racemase